MKILYENKTKGFTQISVAGKLDYLEYDEDYDSPVYAALISDQGETYNLDDLLGAFKSRKIKITIELLEGDSVPLETTGLLD